MRDILSDFHDGDKEDEGFPLAFGHDEEERATRFIAGGAAELYNDFEVNADVFEELHLPANQAHDVQEAWSRFLRTAETIEAAGDALAAAMLHAAPNLRPLFKSPRAVFAIKLVGAMTTMVLNLADPSSLKQAVETLAFQHLQVDVTIPRVAILRDAMADLLSSELGSGCGDAALAGFRTLLNYTGGSIIYVRKTYSDRFRIIATSWANANKRNRDPSESDADAEFFDERPAPRYTDGSSVGSSPRKLRPEAFLSTNAQHLAMAVSGSERSQRGKNLVVPTTFPEMFRFNAAVMGFGFQPWMNEMLAAFDTIVCNVTNATRLHEECDVLVLKVSRCPGFIRLPEFQTVLLASLRSLNPRGWGSEHEVAWMWFWDNIERLIKAQLGKPKRYGRALQEMLGALDEQERHTFRRNLITTFFATAPAGQDHFRQSTTRLHFIVDKVVNMTADLYKQPAEVVFRLGALGLRHVGYGVPAELFGPFVCAAVEAARKIAANAEALDAFRWSLGLISRVLVRVVSEGSTIVMRAINANSAKQLRKAVACAPRKDRSEWVLSVAVGSESISPLMWALERGSIEAADAILRDLLTIRADRDRYYFGADALFARHPDIVRRLSSEAPALLWTLLDGLVWRSRTVEDGRRRAAYFCRHLLVRPDGKPSSALEDICHCADPRLACHPVVAHLIDLVWAKVMETVDPNANNVEAICRYGGTTSLDAAWPEEDSAATNTTVEDRLERLEALVRAVAKRQKQSCNPRGHGGFGGETCSVFSSCSGDGGDSHCRSDAPSPR